MALKLSIIIGGRTTESLALCSALLLFSISRLRRISIIVLWKVPHFCSFCCRYHITLSLCTFIVLCIASSTLSSTDFDASAPRPSPAAHLPSDPSFSLARLFNATVASVDCRTCSAFESRSMAAFNSRRSCFASASICVRCASLRCTSSRFGFLRLSLYLRRPGWPVNRYGWRTDWR